jgi:hypothetical protein
MSNHKSEPSHFEWQYYDENTMKEKKRIIWKNWIARSSIKINSEGTKGRYENRRFHVQDLNHVNMK